MKCLYASVRLKVSLDLGSTFWENSVKTHYFRLFFLCWFSWKLESKEMVEKLAALKANFSKVSWVVKNILENKFCRVQENITNIKQRKAKQQNSFSSIRLGAWFLCTHNSLLQLCLNSMKSKIISSLQYITRLGIASVS